MREPGRANNAQGIRCDIRNGDPTREPCGVITIAPETQAVLAAEDDFARSQFVELQMAVEPCLVAQIDAAEYRTCLRGLVRDAIGRASSGVLVTAMRQAEGVEIAVLDDGTDPAHQQSAGAAQPGRELPLPRGATLIARYEQGRGMTMLLSVRQLESLAVPPGCRCRR